MADILLGALHLPGDLIWEDEFDWAVVERSDTPEFTLSGAPVFEESSKTAGRPITLVAKSESRGPIWITRQTVLSLQTMAASPDTIMTLVLSDLRSFRVRFRGDAVQATPVYHIAPSQTTDRYYLTISLITTE